ncbi:GntR family transcriptional regulator [Sulfitobacter porphyrae]|uniref:GntR family transcriptional regulator n=1 Tax=Sulfitobacter porphyrae TaxID=1246864 RepID=A0ABW2BBH7_9RHOB
MPWTTDILKSGKPRYIAIADAIAQKIADGTLAMGDRLPPQRKLAETLGIDFTTVSRAYAEAQTRGLVDSHVGRGTFISGQIAHSGPDPMRLRDEDLSMNMPPEPTDPDLQARMKQGLDYVSANLIGLLRYQSPSGPKRTVWQRQAGSACAAWSRTLNVLR